LRVIKDNRRWYRARADKDVDVGSKAKLAEGPWRKRGHPFLG
jgi:hypothetical protein